jgi:hypothetical protein
MLIRSSFRQRAAVLTVLLALFPLPACRAEGPESGVTVLLETHLRFIEQDPPPAFSRQRFFSSKTLFDWRPHAPAGCVQVWPQRPAEETFLLNDKTARLNWQADRVLISVPGLVDADTVDRIDLEIKSLTDQSDRVGAAAVLWKVPGQKFTARRLLDDPAARSAGDNAWLFRFPLASQPTWRGQVSHLRLVLSPSVSSPLALCSLRGATEQLRPENLPELLREGFKADFAGQTRNAIPGLPGLAVERDLQVPRGAELRFAYALPPSVRRPVTFRVTMDHRDALAVELFQATLSPEPDAGWRHAAVDLSAFAGRRVRLRLATTAEGQVEPERGFPMWGNPEVLAARRTPLR